MIESEARLPIAYEGAMPRHTGDLKLQTQGMAPIPETNRYGSLLRMFTVWFTPNMEISGIFIGTLAVVVGLGFQLGLLAIILGTIIGAIPVAILCTWGPQTGTGQVPLARMPFGRSVVLPAAVQLLSSIGWLAIGALFGAQAAHLLFHVPFWVGALIVLVLEAAISIYGYDLVHRAQWPAPLDMAVATTWDGDAPARAPATIAAYEQAGVTWWMQEARSLSDARERIRIGPGCR
jgi:NCS1 family nucleobase:cation symporter-1